MKKNITKSKSGNYNKVNFQTNNNVGSQCDKILNPLLKIIIKISILSIIIILLIIYSDVKGYFNPNSKDNHTLTKWNSFYELTSKGNDIDIMLFGNSHLYTGINPKNLSLALGTTSFIFASPGTNIADSYFSLKEAAKKCKPKLVVVETYGINGFNPYNLDGANLSEQIKSFSARKDFIAKIKSTPFLFSVENYLYAWSTSIRNHDYIFTNREQLENNKILIERGDRSKQIKKLYLGRYVRFTKGLETDILEQYKIKGAPVKGEDFTYSKYAEYYVRKIVEFCNNQKIDLMFLTLPMYEKHISNFDIWDKKLSELLNVFPVKWLNMQKMPGYEGFDKYAFENTYSQNQHMTYNGSLLATYKLANFIRDSISVEMSMRKEDAKWHKLFYGEEGYFENFSPSSNDKNNIIICNNKSLRNVTLENCLLLGINSKKSNKIIAKVNKKYLENLDYQEAKLRLLLKIEVEGKEQIISVDLMYDMFHSPKDEVLFIVLVKPIKINEIIDGAIIM